jgi:broad specificity phosphatase PhoE
MRILFTALTLLVLATPAAAQTIFVVRHAERADASAGGPPMMGSDPDLSEAGKARAQSLAAVLKDAQIAAIYTTEFKRTRQTAEPVAQAAGIEPTVVSARDIPALVEKMKGATGNVLVVGHSNTVGEVIRSLGVSDPVKLEDADYDNLFVVVKGNKPTLVRLHFR